MRNDSIQFSVRTKVILFSLLVILGLVFRFPTVPHEIGQDSFAIHLMANSISEFGCAKWWLNPASILGSYPYSTSPSAVPFILSGMSQCTNMDTEKVILLYSMILGLFSIFGAYLMAGAIWNNDISKFLIAILFSASQGIISLSTWTATGRTLFVISLPFFVYLLLRTHTFKVRFGILTFIVLAMLFVTHHYIYFVIPVIISYLIIGTLYKTGKYIKSIRIPENFANFAMLACFSIMFLISFFYRSLWWGDPQLMRTAECGGSIYVWISNVMLEQYVRYIGFLIIFVVGGYMYLLFKRNKKLEEWFLLLALVSLAPFLYIITYTKWFILPFTCLLMGVGLANVASAKMGAKKKKYRITFVIILLLFSTIFTGYYQYLHFLNDPDPRARHMEERTYVGALWIKDNINKDKNMFTESYIGHRVFSTSRVPTLTGVDAADLAYGFVDPEKLEVKQIYSPYSVDFYFNDPYRIVNHTLPTWHLGVIAESDINDRYSWAYRSTYGFNLTYYAENKDFSNTFTRSVKQTKNNLYDNGKIRVWYLEADLE